MAAVPLVVDLDGTLLRTDTLHESAIRLLRDSPFDVLRLPLWLARGKAALKRRLATKVGLDPAALPYRGDLLAWLREQREAGRPLVLCTAADRAVAASIAEHLGIFDQIIASDGETNLAGRRKAEALVRHFGPAGFDYAGNSSDDLPVWASARLAIVVDAPADVARRARAQGEVEREFSGTAAGLRTWARMLRVHQWLKNLLLFVPLVAAHRFGDAGSWLTLVLAFASFSLCASTVYIVNDLLDLESDRLHPRKRNRPFASGAVPVRQGVLAAPILLAASVALGLQVGGAFLYWLIGYFVLTSLYSLLLKRFVLVDCVTLALLYTLRIVAGAAAARLELSFWLLAFTAFLFLSLAFVKRYAELLVQAPGSHDRVHGRGYYASDAPLVQAFGVAAGYGSAVVLALYLNSDAVLGLYRWPQIAGATVPVLVFWISWVWLQAHRGRMDDDPMVFALRDPVSIAASGVFGTVLLLATIGSPW